MGLIDVRRRENECLAKRCVGGGVSPSVHIYRPLNLPCSYLHLQDITYMYCALGCIRISVLCKL